MSAPSFADVCRVWPMRSEAERLASLQHFEALPPDQRPSFIHSADAYRAWSEFAPALDLAKLTLPEAARSAPFLAAASLASVESRIRALMKGAA